MTLELLLELDFIGARKKTQYIKERRERYSKTQI